MGDAPGECGPAQTLCNRWKRWSDNGVFAPVMTGLAAEGAANKTIAIDATSLKAPRPIRPARPNGGADAGSGAVRGAENDPRDRFPENGA